MLRNKFKRNLISLVIYFSLFQTQSTIICFKMLTFMLRQASTQMVTWVLFFILWLYLYLPSLIINIESRQTIVLIFIIMLGYEYSRNHDRLWRGTRSTNSKQLDLGCVGVDPNRNFPFHWNESGASSNPCRWVGGNTAPTSTRHPALQSSNQKKYRKAVFKEPTKWHTDCLEMFCLP